MHYSTFFNCFSEIKAWAEDMKSILMALLLWSVALGGLDAQSKQHESTPATVPTTAPVMPAAPTTVATDNSEAAGYRVSAVGGNVEAARKLGILYLTGPGVAQDLNEALKWLRIAADQGDAYAQFEIGRMYDNGNGVEQDYKRALYWYLKASNQGNAQAYYYLGFMYEAGDGVSLDQTQAFFWWKKAAEKGDATSQSLIGEMYERGEGVAKDQALAAEWYRKAAAQGIAGAKEALNRLAKAQQPPAPVHSYKDSSGNLYLVSDADYQRLFPIKSALDVESQNLDRLEAQKVSTGNRIRQDRGNLDNTDSVAVDNFNAEVDAYNSSQVYVRKRTDAFNARADDFNKQLHRVGTLVK